jgi:hypothetical protein
MSPVKAGYHARVAGAGCTMETIQLDEETDRHAVYAAFGAVSPFGHSLWNGGRFLGYFEAGPLRLEGHRPLPVATTRAMGAGSPC